MYIDKNCISDKNIYPSGLMCKGTFCTVRCPMVIMFPFHVHVDSYGLFMVSVLRLELLYFLYTCTCINSELKLRRKNFNNLL